MQNFILHSTCDVADALEIIRKNEGIAKKTLINGTIVNVSSLRLKTFAHKGVTCANCGIVGEYFALERDGHPETHPYHLTLYGINKEGKDVLMTHDHILARALGGANTLENTQTMCSPCNGEKGKLENLQAQFVQEVKNFQKKMKQWGKVIDLSLAREQK